MVIKITVVRIVKTVIDWKTANVYQFVMITVMFVINQTNVRLVLPTITHMPVFVSNVTSKTVNGVMKPISVTNVKKAIKKSRVSVNLFAIIIVKIV